MRAIVAGVVAGLLLSPVTVTGAHGQPAAPNAPPVTTDAASPAAPAPTATATPGAATAGLGRNRVAWLLVSGSLAFATIGAVLAYSANSSEKDIQDLYVGFGGYPPVWSERTKQTYDELVDEGRRYERLSWISFGLAGATAITAGILFWRNRDEVEPARVAPIVTPRGAGVSVRF
ncbi:MAG: hypothetical protein AB7O24_06690 [Kofleriaceae bacterium]